MTWTQSGYNFIIIIVQQRQVHMHYCECRQPGLLPRMRQWERNLCDLYIGIVWKKKPAPGTTLWCPNQSDPSVWSEAVWCWVWWSMSVQSARLPECDWVCQPERQPWYSLHSQLTASIESSSYDTHRQGRHTEGGHTLSGRGWKIVEEMWRGRSGFQSDKGGKLSLPTVVIFSMHQNVRYNHSKTHNNDFLSYTCHE